MFHQPADEGRNGFPAASQHTRKSNSFDIGTVCLSLPCFCAHTTGAIRMLFSSTHGCLSQVHVLLLLFIIHNNGAMPLLFFYQMEAAGGLLFDVLPRPVESAGCVLCYALSCNLPFFSSYTPLCLSVSCHFPSGMEPDTPYDLERSSDRRFPLKKPCFPQYRNRSLDCPAGTRCMYLFLLLLICVG